MRCRKNIFASLPLLALIAFPAYAQTDLGDSKYAVEKAAPATKTSGAKPNVDIAAQVGDEAISSVDVNNRLKFIIATAHLSDTPDVISHIRPQVIRSLVDEKLQLQEAAKNDIKVSDKDISDAIEAIEKQRGMPPGSIAKMLQAGNVPKETFTQQVKAQLSWNRLLIKKIRPQVHISDTEIDMISNRILAEPAAHVDNTPHEYKISVLVLPVDKPGREGEVRVLGQKLVKEVRGGASFEEVSRQFSSSAASAGGKVETFWVTLEQIDPALAKALQGAKAGTIIDPVRTDNGYTIIKVYDLRGIPGSKPIPAPVKEAATVNANPLSDKEAKHEQLYNILLQQKMELEAQKYLRNLRRETFIDVR